jgi:cyclophilin family peptidyl-prolyl cis-trans isomerase
VENFVTHIKNGYYNRIIFHRVIKKFVSLQCQFWLSEMAGV